MDRRGGRPLAAGALGTLGPSGLGRGARPAGLAAVLALTVALASSFAQVEARERSAHATVFATKWVHENLLDIGFKAATRRLDSRDQYFASVAFSKVLIAGLPVLGPRLRGSSIELEGQLVRHFGTMNHPEATAAIVWRSPDAALPGGAGVNFAVGSGLSYAFGTPHLEGVRRHREVRRLLSYLSLELELSHAALPGLSLVPRLHHRSGVYGLVGPRGDGANYIGVGLRFDLP